MMSPSFTSFLTFWRELALAISVVSLGSSQIFLCPHLRTEAASLFCSRRVLAERDGQRAIDKAINTKQPTHCPS